MLFIFRQFTDPVGGGDRGELRDFALAEHANKVYHELSELQDTIYMSMIVGSQLKEFHNGGRVLNDDELRISSLDSDDADKEKV